MEHSVSDRRQITGEDLRSLLDMCKGLVDSVHLHDRDLAVLKTRMDGTEERLARMENDLRDTRGLVQRVFDCLTQHAAQEEKDRNKLFAAVISVLVSIIGTCATAAWALFIKPHFG